MKVPEVENKISKKNAISIPVQLVIVFLLSLSSFIIVWLAQSVLYTTIDIKEYLLFHNITEFFSVMVSLSIFGIGWFAYDQSKNRHALFLSCAFLAIGIFDFMHTLSYRGMPDFINPNPTNKATQLWIAARLFSAIAFLISAFIYSDSSYRWITKRILLTATLIITGLVFTGVIYYPSYLPAAFIDGIGLTPFKIYSEYVINIILTVALIAYWKRFSKTGEQVNILFMEALIIGIFSELAFTLYMSAFDTYNMLGHIYKIFSFVLIYYGLFTSSIKYPYMELNNSIGKLCESEEKYRFFIESANDAIMIHKVIEGEKPGPFIEINELACKLFGYTREEFSRLTPQELNDPQHLDHIPIVMGQLLKEGHAFFETVMLRKDKCHVPVEISTRLLKIRDEKYILSIVRDITERKRAEEALESFNRDFGAFLDQTTDFVYFKDINSRFRFCSRTLAAITGHTDWHEMIGKHDREVFPPDTARIYEEEEVPVFSEGRPLLKKIDPYYDTAGNLRYVETNKWPLFDASGKIVGIFGISRDITERNKAEEELQKHRFHLEEMVTERTAQLERMNRLLVGRQLKMIELKKRIEELEKENPGKVKS